MNREAVSGIMLSLLLIGMLTLAFNVQQVRANGTIYIRPDGSVEGTDKIQRDGDVYTFTDNIYDEIVVERDNIVVDGAGYILQGTPDLISKGIDLTGRSNVTIKNMEIKTFGCGIYLKGSSTNSISGNNITFCVLDSIKLEHSSNNNVSWNKITGGHTGIFCRFSSKNIILGNNMTANMYDVVLLFSSKNIIIGNTITDSDDGICLVTSTTNSISRNCITDNHNGINFVDYSHDNTIFGNEITRNFEGMRLTSSANNKFYNNNFRDNTLQVFIATSGYTNFWDDGYPSGGNFWSDHVTVDDCCGVNQDEPGSDGIVDDPYIIDGNNRDNYPLVEPWSPLPKTIDELKTEIEELGSEGQIDNQGIVKSLIAKLNVAQKLVDKGKIDQAKNILQKAFIQQVKNLSGIHITSEVADILIESAEYILSHL